MPNYESFKLTCQRNDLGQGMVCLYSYRLAMLRKVVGSSLQRRRPGAGLMTGRTCWRGAVMTGRTWGGADMTCYRFNNVKLKVLEDLKRSSLLIY